MTTSFKAKKSLAELYALWDKFGRIPIAHEGKSVDCLEEPFLDFRIGTHREVVWRWFEEQHSGFLVGDIMQGIRRPDAQVCAATTG